MLSEVTVGDCTAPSALRLKHWVSFGRSQGVLLPANACSACPGMAGRQAQSRSHNHLQFTAQTPSGHPGPGELWNYNLQTTDNPAEHKWSSCTFSRHQRGNKAQKRGTLSPDLLGITRHSKDNQDTFATILEWAPAQFHCILKLDAVWNLNSHK